MSPEKKTHSRTLYPEIEVFPHLEVEEIKKRGEQLVSPFWIFSRFGLFYPRQNRDLIIAMISQSTYGNEVNFLDTKRGLRICAGNVKPLLKAMEEIYLSTIDLLPKKTKKTIDKLSATQKAENDWKK